MYRPVVTKILEEASKCYGDDSPLEDPMVKSGYDPYEVKKAIEFCRAEGLIGKRAVFGKNAEEVGIERWWTGGLMPAGIEELEERRRSIRSLNNRLLTERDSNTLLW